jgi:hypothetical protein
MKSKTVWGNISVGLPTVSKGESVVVPAIRIYEIKIMATEPMSVEYRHFHAVMCGFVEDPNHNENKSDASERKCWSAYWAPGIEADGYFMRSLFVTVIVSEKNKKEAADIHNKLTSVLKGVTRYFGKQVVAVTAPPTLITEIPVDTIFTNRSAVSSISIELITPAVIEHGKKLRLPLIGPSKLLISLGNKWNYYFDDARPLTVDVAKIESVTSLQYINGTTETNFLKNAAYPGFLGELKYGFDSTSKNVNSRNVAITAKRLLLFGELIGVGAKSAWGFGRMKITDTKPWR